MEVLLLMIPVLGILLGMVIVLREVSSIVVEVFVMIIVPRKVFELLLVVIIVLGKASVVMAEVPVMIIGVFLVMVAVKVVIIILEEVSSAVLKMLLVVGVTVIPLSLEVDTHLISKWASR